LSARSETAAVARPAESVKHAGVEETRTRILSAARAIYASKGSRGTTTREVAERAGVNEATLFRHFGTKGQLLAAMLDHYSATSEFPAILERVRGYESIEEQLLALGRAAFESMTRKQDLIRVSMAEELTDPAGHLCAWRGPTEARRALSGFFAEKVERRQLDGDPEWLARVFMSLFFSLVMARRIWADVEFSQESAVVNMVEIFLNGARAR
jgi:AcrR family transcriptional regulator